MDKEQKKKAGLELLLEFDKSRDERSKIYRKSLVYSSSMKISENEITSMTKVLATGDRIGIMYKEGIVDKKTVAIFIGGSLLRLWVDHNLKDYAISLRKHVSNYYENYEELSNDLQKHFYEKVNGTWKFSER